MSDYKSRHAQFIAKVMDIAMSATQIDDDDDDDEDEDGATFGQVIGGQHPANGQQPVTGSNSASGSAGQTVGQQVSQRIGSGSSTTPGGNVTWPNVSGSTSGSLTGGTTYSITTTTGTNVQWVTTTLPTLTTTTIKPKAVKTKVRYVVVAKDKTTRELKELPVITPQEMIGISKFLELVTTNKIAVFVGASLGYNFSINWSDVITSLGIDKHFAPGLPLADYDDAASDVLDVLLHYQ